MEAGRLCGTAEAVVTVEDGVRLDYRTGWETGFLAGVSPEIALIGRYHGLDAVDYLDVTVDNPDERDKAFAGILIQTLRGRRYYLPVAQGRNAVCSPPWRPAHGARYTGWICGPSSAAISRRSARSRRMCPT